MGVGGCAGLIAKSTSTAERELLGVDPPDSYIVSVHARSTANAINEAVAASLADQTLLKCARRDDAVRRDVLLFTDK